MTNISQGFNYLTLWRQNSCHMEIVWRNNVTVTLFLQSTILAHFSLPKALRAAQSAGI